MLKRYDANKDEMVELTQDYFDSIQKQFANMMLYFSRNCPAEYKNWHDQYILTGSTNA